MFHAMKDPTLDDDNKKSRQHTKLSAFFDAMRY